ncbi:MAG TPA: amidohydrolase [Acidobacteriota bacterium]
MQKTARLLALFLFISITVSYSKEPLQPPDRIFVGGKIWTGDKTKPWAQAMAISGEIISAVGSDAEIMKVKAPNTQVVNLNGRFVSPGFNDAHMHFLVRDQVMIEESDNLQTIQKKLAEFAKANPKATCILGQGWGYAAFPDKKPDKKYFDAIVSDRPVILDERDGHMTLLNSKALEMAKITRDTPDPPQGRIVHDSNGEPTGELQEKAQNLAEHLITPPTTEENYKELKKLLDVAASYGLTSVTNATFQEDNLPAFDKVLAEGGLKIRFYRAVTLKKDVTAEDFAYYHSLSKKYPEKLMKFGAAKGFVDGVVDAQTAVMFEPYTTGKNGIANWTQEELNATAVKYDREGFQIMLHAIGDKAIAMALDTYEYVAKTNGPRDRRDRVEHIEVPRLSDLPRFKQLGVIASTQALFANPDKTTLENYSPLLGPDRASHANAFKLFDDAGAVQAFGSDWPVFSMEVLKGIYCAASRKTPEGTPPGGYFPQHRISVEAALHHFTVDAAYASFDEKVKGSLTPGKFADFVVLSENILDPPVERVLKTKVLLTVMGGKDTFRSAQF